MFNSLFAEKVEEVDEHCNAQGCLQVIDKTNSCLCRKLCKDDVCPWRLCFSCYGKSKFSEFCTSIQSDSEESPADKTVQKQPSQQKVTANRIAPAVLKANKPAISSKNTTTKAGSTVVSGKAKQSNKSSVIPSQTLVVSKGNQSDKDGDGDESDNEDILPAGTFTNDTTTNEQENNKSESDDGSQSVPPKKRQKKIEKPKTAINGKPSWIRGGTVFLGSKAPVSASTKTTTSKSAEHAGAKDSDGIGNQNTSFSSSTSTTTSLTAVTDFQNFVGPEFNKNMKGPAFQSLPDSEAKSVVEKSLTLLKRKSNQSKLFFVNQETTAFPVEILQIDEAAVNQFHLTCNHFGMLNAPKLPGIPSAYVTIVDEAVGKALGLPDPSQPFVIVVEITPHVSLLIYIMRHLLQTGANLLRKEIAEGQAVALTQFWQVMRHETEDSLTDIRKQQIHYSLIRTILHPKFCSSLQDLSLRNRNAKTLVSKVGSQLKCILDRSNDRLNRMVSMNGKDMPVDQSAIAFFDMCVTDSQSANSFDSIATACSFRTNMIENHDSYTIEDFPYIALVEFILLKLGLVNKQIVEGALASGADLLSLVSVDTEALAIAIVSYMIKTDFGKNSAAVKSKSRREWVVAKGSSFVTPIIKERLKMRNTYGVDTSAGLVPWQSAILTLRKQYVPWAYGTEVNDEGGEEREGEADEEATKLMLEAAKAGIF